MKAVRLTREDLYERVWAEPMTKLAQHYGLSDVGLAKTCKRLRVPVPGRGYWAKKAAGHAVKPKPLPALPPNPLASDREVTLGYSPIPMERPSLPLLVRNQAEFEAAPENRIVVSDNLRAAHPLVRKTSQALKGTAKRETEFIGNYREPHLDLQVTRDLLTRALQLMDAVVKAFEERGWKISLGSKSEEQDRKSYVSLLGTQIPFGIRERIKKVENPPPKAVKMAGGGMYTPWEAKYRDLPSGRLSIVLRERWGKSVVKSLDDTPNQRLEDRLNEFMVAVVARAYENLEWNAGREEHDRNWRIQELLREERARRQREELARIQALEQQAADWNQSQILTAYIAAVRAIRQKQPDAVQLGEEFESWLTWAEDYAAQLDPLHQSLEQLSAPKREA
jgi:hypothetical protein